MDHNDKMLVIQKLREISNTHGHVTRREIVDLCERESLPFPHFITNSKRNRVGRGLYSINPSETTEKQNRLHSGIQETISVPKKDRLYIKTDNHKVIRNVIDSGMFFPVYLSGPSGNGKTLLVEQACAELGRQFIRINITTETEEDDLLGGFRLINGETKWFDGPLVMALKVGAIVLLDEIDLATNKIMCLQSILEGKGVFLKKIGQFVEPVDGFNIIATANTKGQGDDTGKYLGTNILNEAFMERFPLWIDQKYPSKKQEEKILKKLSKNLNIDLDNVDKVPNFIEALVNWASEIRSANEQDISISDEIITTRRLCHILRTYKIIGDVHESVRLCLNRYNQETQESFYELFKQFIRTTTEEEVSEIVQEPKNIDNINYKLLPSEYRKQMEDYVNNKTLPVCSYMRYLLYGDETRSLKEVISIHDNEIIYHRLKKWVSENVPRTIWGSLQKVEHWIEK